jgi:DeoR/GlpR family transcriptional regulator of sugar metabolism
MRASARKRREAILSEVYENKEVTSSSLAERLGVSEATIRRDLRALADSGQLDLVYGGAVPPTNSDYSYRSKALRNVEAKKTVGQLAAGLVQDGEQLFIDSGTTCFEMTPHLRPKRGLSIIVNSARLALELDTPNVDVIMLGGHYRPDRMDTVGPLAMAALDQLRGYVAFISADGLSTEFGLTASDVESAFMYRLAVRHARETVLLVDHSKFLSPSLCKIVEWDPIARVVTDRPPDAKWMEFFAEREIEVITPRPEKEEEEYETPQR